VCSEHGTERDGGKEEGWGEEPLQEEKERLQNFEVDVVVTGVRLQEGRKDGKEGI
jgi:hypothetical protein